MFYGQLLFLYQLELRTAAGSRAGNGTATSEKGKLRTALGDGEVQWALTYV